MSNMNCQSCKSCRDKNTIDTPRSCFSTLSSMMEGLVLRLHEITVGSVYSISIFWRFVSHLIWYTQWRIATWSHVSGYFRVGRSYSQISHMRIYSNVYMATLWPLYRKVIDYVNLAIYCLSLVPQQICPNRKVKFSRNGTYPGCAYEWWLCRIGLGS